MTQDELIFIRMGLQKRIGEDKKKMNLVSLQEYVTYITMYVFMPLLTEIIRSLIKITKQCFVRYREAFSKFCDVINSFVLR